MKEYKKYTDDEWYQVLLKSIESNIVNEHKLPSFPNEEIQKRYIGHSKQQALAEGYQFYKAVKGYSKALGKEVHDRTNLLDFGMGWGRYTRFFMKDIEEVSLFGCDPSIEIINVCKECGVPGSLTLTEPTGKLPYPDNFFDIIIAYSVFTHLSESETAHWINEISRVSKPGCVFIATLEPRRFLTLIEKESKVRSAESNWWKGLSRYADEIQKYYKLFDSGKFVFLDNGGKNFSKNLYGDSVIPFSYIENNWKDFSVIEYIDNPNKFWQAVIILQNSKNKK